MFMSPYIFIDNLLITLDGSSFQPPVILKIRVPGLLLQVTFRACAVASIG
jgi:hypothetical protein